LALKLDDALLRLDVLSAIAERTKRFDGFRWCPIAITSLLGILGGLLQTALIFPAGVSGGPADLTAFVQYWVVVAVVCLIVILLEMGWRYLRSPTLRTQRLTLEFMTRLLPALAAGAIVTWVLATTAPESGWMLPGLWSIFLGLGVFAATSLVDDSFRWVGAWYLAAGVLSLYFSRGPWELHPLSMAIPFSVGQGLTAILVYRSTTFDSRDSS
jgi:hypothetical protein